VLFSTSNAISTAFLDSPHSSTNYTKGPVQKLSSKSMGARSTYTMPYWLYPPMAIFLTGFAKPSTVIDKNFTHWHQSVRKDIEWAFGVLQARWRILALPARHCDRQYLGDIVRKLGTTLSLTTSTVKMSNGAIPT
jgi:hypothetical protein